VSRARKVTRGNPAGRLSQAPERAWEQTFVLASQTSTTPWRVETTVEAQR
jgi:hypothetical protein